MPTNRKTLEQLGANLRRLRVGRGLSLEQLAKRVGWGESQIRKMEAGTRGTTPDGYQRIANALGVTIADLFAFPARSRRARKSASAPNVASR